MLPVLPPQVPMERGKMIIIDVILLLIILILLRTILWLSHQKEIAEIDRDAAQRMTKLKVQQYEEMKAFAGESVSTMEKIGHDLRPPHSAS